MCPLILQAISFCFFLFPVCFMDKLQYMPIVLFRKVLSFKHFQLTFFLCCISRWQFISRPWQKLRWVFRNGWSIKVQWRKQRRYSWGENRKQWGYGGWSWCVNCTQTGGGRDLPVLSELKDFFTCSLKSWACLLIYITALNWDYNNAKING